jgi:hypothetical protein
MRRVPLHSVLLGIAFLWVVGLYLLQWRTAPVVQIQQQQPPPPPSPQQQQRQQQPPQQQPSAGAARAHDNAAASYMCNRMSMELPIGTEASVLSLAALGGAVGGGAPQPSATLQQNVSVRGHVALEQYQYYQVCLAHHTHEHEVSFEVACKRGDADLYISTEEARPAVDRATWISADRGDDRITLHTGMEEFARAARLGSAGSQVLYVAVYGRTEADFSITVLVRDAMPKPQRRRKRSLRGRKHAHRLVHHHRRLPQPGGAAGASNDL